MQRLVNSIFLSVTRGRFVRDIRFLFDDYMLGEGHGQSRREQAGLSTLAFRYRLKIRAEPETLKETEHTSTPRRQWLQGN